MGIKALHVDIIYHDNYLVAIDKPPGLLVHRSLVAKRETSFALQAVRDQIGQHVYPVHRLDRPTSGVLLFALSSSVAASLTTLFTQREVKKTYRSIIRGHVADRYEIDYPLREILDKKSDKRAFKDKPPQTATSSLTCINRYTLPLPVGRYQEARFSFVELTPKTGRKHQLRRHMAHIRHPIIGDTTHGDGKQNKFVRHHFNFYELALTCTSMELIHPVTMQPIKFQATYHQSMGHLLHSWKHFKVAGSADLVITKHIGSE